MAATTTGFIKRLARSALERVALRLIQQVQVHLGLLTSRATLRQQVQLLLQVMRLQVAVMVFGLAVVIRFQAQV